MDLMLLVLVGFPVCLAIGMAVGRYQAFSGLLIGVYRDDRTPHKIGDGFFYVVPEGEYCKMRCEVLRTRAAAFQLDEAAIRANLDKFSPPTDQPDY